MSKEIEMYLEKNHLSYNSAIRNNVGELVGIGDLIDQNTKPLIDEITTLESQFEQSDKMYSDLLAKKDDFKLKWENAENEIAKLKASKSEANEAVEFAYFILDNFTQNTIGWHHNNWSGDLETYVNYSPKQLYEIFKTRNNK